MFDALHYGRLGHDMLETLANDPMPRVRATSFTRRLRMMIIISLASFSPVLASPFAERMHVRSQILARDSKGTLQVWIPVIGVVLVIVAGLTLMWKRRVMRTGILLWGNAAALGSGVAVQPPLEVTADQLAGGTPNGTSGTASPAVAARRARRNRRTPSQISTKSLPAYNKEPGDEELVIFRGPTELEDGPTTIVMPSLNEQDGDSLHSRNTSQASSTYPLEPLSAHDIPLLQHGSFSNMGTPNTGEDTSIRRSIDTSQSSEDAVDPRGEAPPYFEVVDHPPAENDPGAIAEPPMTSLEPTSPSPPLPSEERATRRRSGFKSIFHALDPRSRHTVVGTSQPGANNASAHSRNGSSPNPTSPETRHARGASRQHRPSQSGSGSMLSLSPFRTISRQRSINTMNSNQMTSPSLISLNSISAPLTHTVVRTEFTYPKAGPTPEQLKLISSRETFARFGIPYGADAIAYAASTSRQELDPPPGFHASTSDIYLPATRGTGASGSALSLATPEPSNADQTAAPNAGAASVGNDEGDGAAQQEQPAGPSSSTTPSTTTTVNGTHTPPPSKLPALGLVPPSAFKQAFAPPRSASRTSSMMSTASYATAAESIGDFAAFNPELDLGSPTALRHSGAETPTTPRLPPLFAESTDRASHLGVDTGRAVWL